MRALARSFLLLGPWLALSSCGGGGAQNRPTITGVFPADGTVVPGWLEAVRVTYDDPIHVLNSQAVRLADVDLDVGIYVEAIADPGDPRSILVKPLAGGHFFANHTHHLVVQEGAVINLESHYALQEWSTYFGVGSAPNLFVTSSTGGGAYEIDTATGAVLHTTPPPPGFRAREPVGTSNRIWVWLDPSPGPGNSVLGTLAPGDAAMATVALTGETGTRVGVSFAVSIDGRTLYATAMDQGTNRLRVHRIDVASRLELASSIELSPTLAGSPASFKPSVDLRRNRLYVPFSDGVGGGKMAVVDLASFTEVDVGPLPGVDALVTPDGSGDVVYEPMRDVIYVLLEDEATPGFLVITPRLFEQFPAREPSFQGAPRSLFITPPGEFVVQGLEGYATTYGLVRSDAADIGEGFTVSVGDDIGGILQGSNRVPVMIGDPTVPFVHVFASNGSETFLVDFDWDAGDVGQVDLDGVTPGAQALRLAPGVPGVVTGAAYPLGTFGP